MGQGVLRILDVSPRPVHPVRRGSDARSAALLGPLAARHDVRGFSIVGWEDRDGAPAPYPEIRVEHRAGRAVIATLERTWVRSPVLASAGLRVARAGAALDRELGRCDVCLVEFPWLVARCRPHVAPGRLVLCSHNVEADKFPSWAEAAGHPPGSRLLARGLGAVERHAVSRADLIVAVSEPDAARFTSLYGVPPERIVVVPNAVDVEEFRPAGPAERAAARAELGLGDEPLAVLVGTRAPHNVPALRWLERIAPRARGWTLAAVGMVGKLARPGGRVLTPGLTPDVRPWLAAADVALCPVRHGGGTKLKLLEAWAAGLPVLGFREVLEGTSGREGEHLEACEPSEAGLLAGLRRLEDPARRAALGSAGRALAEREHAAVAAAARLERALTGLLAQDPPPPRG